jgi:Zinc dependent phospholipase C
LTWGVRLALAFVGVGVLFLLAPEQAHAWTPGTHIYLGESILANLALLPPTVADLLRAYPFDFLYGNIAADSSIAKHYAPLGRHCHYWHVGQEIHDLADSDALRAFGLGYLCHLSADTVAHNYFVPRQLMLTSSTAAVGHSYWETRVESHLGDAYSKTAKDVILLDHTEADSHLDRIIAPTIFSVRTNRRLFRGMVHLTETTSWQRATQVAREYSRWRLRDEDVERHLGLSYDFMFELLGGPSPSAHQLDPSGERPLKAAKRLRRKVLRASGRRNTAHLREAALEHFGLPDRVLAHWSRIAEKLPWGAPEGAVPSPKALVRRIS